MKKIRNNTRRIRADDRGETGLNPLTENTANAIPRAIAMPQPKPCKKRIAI